MKCFGVSIAVCGVAVMFWTASAQGQETMVGTNVAPAPSARFPAAWYPAESNVAYTQASVKDVPYTAKMVTTDFYLNQKTGERTKLVDESFQARDGEGRTRNDGARRSRKSLDGSGKMIDVREVSVNDPVSHCSFRWEEPWVAPTEPAAIVTCMSLTLHYSGSSLDVWSWANTDERKEEHLTPDETDVTEPLGLRTIEGVRAKGARRTRTVVYPQPELLTVIVAEIWYSPELKEMLSLKTEGTIGGKSEAMPEFLLKDIRRDEPDPKLFYPPDGYRIQKG